MQRLRQKHIRNDLAIEYRLRQNKSTSKKTFSAPTSEDFKMDERNYAMMSTYPRGLT